MGTSQAGQRALPFPLAAGHAQLEALGNAVFPLAPSLTQWDEGTCGHRATLAMGSPDSSTVTVVLLSLAGRWKAGEGTPQDAGALGEQVCRWEAAFCACLAGSGLPFPSSPLTVLAWPRLCWDGQFPLKKGSVLE